MKNYVLAAALLAAAASPAAAQPIRFDDVVRNLRNPDPKARMQALELLRESKYVEAIQPIAPLVNDPVDAIQLAAIETELSFYTVEEISGRKRLAFIIEVRNSGSAETAFGGGPLAVWPRLACHIPGRAIQGGSSGGGMREETSRSISASNTRKVRFV